MSFGSSDPGSETEDSRRTLQFGDVEDARAFLRTLLIDPWNIATLREALRDEGGVTDISILHDHEVLDLLAPMVASGRLRLEAVSQGRAGVGHSEPEEDVEEEEEAAPAESGTHWIEFQFIDSAENPVAIVYDIIDPAGNRETDQDADDGNIRRDDVAEGDWTVILHGLDSAEWASPTALVGQEATVRATAPGVADGTEAEIQIFRRHLETPDDVRDTVTARVTEGRVEAGWTYEPAAGDYGTMRFVAKVIVGDQWGKTRVPLTVNLPGLRNACWAESEAALGASVGMSVEAPGLADGTEVTFAAYRERYTVDDDQVGELTARVNGERADATFEIPRPADGDAVIGEVEYYFIASAEDRETFSDLVRVEDASAVQRAEPPAEGEPIDETQEAEEWLRSSYNAVEEGEEPIENDPDGPWAEEEGGAE